MTAVAFVHTASCDLVSIALHLHKTFYTIVVGDDDAYVLFRMMFSSHSRLGFNKR